MPNAAISNGAYGHDDLATHVAEFSSALAKMGLRKLYPDAIAHALYYVLKHGVALSLDDTELKEIVALDDCITNVLLLEYATRHKRTKVVSAIKSRANEIKAADSREKDKNWLLIYQLWSVKDLKGMPTPEQSVKQIESAKKKLEGKK